MPMHVMADAVVGIFLAISPWLFGFADEGASAWVPHLIIGLAEIGTAAMSETTPRREGLTAPRQRPAAS